MCKFDQDRCNNPRDYEESNCTFLDKMAKIHILCQILQRTFTLMVYIMLYDFLFVFHYYYVFILHHFQDIIAYFRKIKDVTCSDYALEGSFVIPMLKCLLASQGTKLKSVV